MKQIKNSVLLLFASHILFVGFLACHDRPLSIQVVQIEDITDSILVRPSAELDISFFGLGKNRQSACTFRKTSISEKQLNSEFQLTLEAQDYQLHQKPFERELAILEFFTAIRKVFKEDSIAFSQQPLLKYSECFKTIASEMTGMVQQKADRNYVIIHSNLRERSELCDSYSVETRGKILGDPEYLNSIFEEQHILPGSLKSFYVLIIYEPYNKEDDAIFQVIANTYKHILEKRGATVKISASNSKIIFYEP